MSKIYVVSDTHYDFYFKSNSDKFVQRILPENVREGETGGLLIMAGDIGHYNKQNIQFIEQLQKHFDKIAIVMGNHDYYCLNDEYCSGIKRAAEMYDAYKSIGANPLMTIDDNFAYGDHIIGGSTGWFDFSYSQYMFNMDRETAHEALAPSFADFRWIPELKRGYDFSAYKFWSIDKIAALIEIMQSDADIVVSHYPFDMGCVAPQYQLSPYTTFFNFTLPTIYTSAMKGKTFVTGHTHEPYDYISDDGIRCINNAIGYPGEWQETKHTIKEIIF